MFPTVSEVTQSIALGISAVIAAVVIVVLTRGKLGYTPQLKAGQIKSDELDAARFEKVDAHA